MTRRCGDCQLCCRLLPMKGGTDSRVNQTISKMVDAGWTRRDVFDGMIRDFDKPAGQRCQYQRHGKGCTVYTRRPFGCRMWNCAWLVNKDTAEIHRPDRAHYVIDIMPDFVTLNSDTGAAPRKVEVVQIWIDPNYPDCWREPKLRAFIERRAAEGIAALIRFNAGDAIAVFAPALSHDGQWHEIGGGACESQHTGEKLFDGLMTARAQREGVP